VNNLGPTSHRFRETATYSLKHSIKNCSQTAQMETRLLLIAYKNASTLSHCTIAHSLRLTI